jgi:DNA invertase Pin-like site-specific DNA recombinase
MGSEVRSAAVYARISSDQEGTALGVSRQVEDCRRLADSFGWTIGEEYVDNDVSAFSGRKRPAYERMLTDLADGLRDAVLVYHPDRLTRRPIELEQFLEVVSEAKVQHVRFVAGGPAGISDGDGMMVIRMMAAMAANESASKSRRIKRKLDEMAAEGRPHGGSNRPFGYDDDKVTIRSAEADALRTVAARYIAGESLRSLCAWLDEEGVKTVKGKGWRTTSLRYLLSSPRNAGLRQHRGEVVGKAVWEPIISIEDHNRILARMEQVKTTSRRTPRRYVLSGLCRCSKCGGTLFSAARTNTRRYVCLSGPDHRGCGGITVVAAPLEELVTDAVLYRLDTPELADALTGQADDQNTAAVLSDALAADRAQLDELAALYATRQVTSREWIAARNPIEDRIRDTERALMRLTRSDALTGIVGNGQQLRSMWNTLNLTRQAAIIRAILDHVIIHPGSPSATRFDPERAELVWRL